MDLLLRIYWTIVAWIGMWMTIIGGIFIFLVITGEIINRSTKWLGVHKAILYYIMDRKEYKKRKEDKKTDSE